MRIEIIKRETIDLVELERTIIIEDDLSLSAIDLNIVSNLIDITERKKV